MAEITSTQGVNTDTLADYTYVGAGMIVKTEHPDVSGGLTLSFGTGGDYDGWDRFGRVIKQEWTTGSGTNTAILDGYDYTYDTVGNIKTKEVLSDGAPSGLDERYVYDNLNRLYEATRGTLDGSNLITAPTKLWNWTLDALGNWRDNKVTLSPHAGDTNLDGSVGFADLVNVAQHTGTPPPLGWTDGDLNGDGEVDSADSAIVSANYSSTGGNVAADQTRTDNGANELTGITGGSWIVPAYDADGQMISGPQAGSPTTELHYVYDAWARVLVYRLALSKTLVFSAKYANKMRRWRRFMFKNAEKPRF